MTIDSSSDFIFILKAMGRVTVLVSRMKMILVFTFIFLAFYSGIVEIEATTNMNSKLRATNLHNTLLPIGRLYIKSDRYFPLGM